eukprot:scaffold55914_cov15-Tisochrysis_lutea.AAC.3
MPGVTIALEKWPCWGHHANGHIQSTPRTHTNPSLRGIALLTATGSTASSASEFVKQVFLGVTTHSLILLHRPLILLHRSLLKANTRTAPPLTHSADRSLNSAPPLIAKG